MSEFEMRQYGGTLTAVLVWFSSGGRSWESCASCRKRSRGPSSSWATSCSSRETKSTGALNRKLLWVSLFIPQWCDVFLGFFLPAPRKQKLIWNRMTSFSIYTENSYLKMTPYITMNTCKCLYWSYIHWIAHKHLKPSCQTDGGICRFCPCRLRSVNTTKKWRTWRRSKSRPLSDWNRITPAGSEMKQNASKQIKTRSSPSSKTCWRTGRKRYGHAWLFLHGRAFSVLISSRVEALGVVSSCM